MKFIAQSIPDLILIQPKVHGDPRGYFVETFRLDSFEKAVGHAVEFVQDNESKSAYGVLRGLHYQTPPYAQSKLVRVISGKVLDIAVDIRKGSPTFGQHVAIELSDENKYQLYIPRGFAHGFVVLSQEAVLSYKVDNYYAPDCDRGLAFDDPALNIDWQISKEKLQFSDKDRKQPLLSEVSRVFNLHTDYYA